MARNSEILKGKKIAKNRKKTQKIAKKTHTKSSQKRQKLTKNIRIRILKFARNSEIFNGKKIAKNRNKTQKLAKIRLWDLNHFCDCIVSALQMNMLEYARRPKKSRRREALPASIHSYDAIFDRRQVMQSVEIKANEHAVANPRIRVPMGQRLLR